MKNFGLIGAAGFVAPRHLQAISSVGGRLLAAVDPHDSVGVLDRYFPEARFFPEIERFDRHLEKLRRLSDDERVHYMSICTPNYLHDAHVRLALRLRAHAICEKPLVINPWNLDQLAELEQDTGCRVYTVLQLRHAPALAALKQRLTKETPDKTAEVDLAYVTRRGPWYLNSWKGNEERSGGIASNIGIHFFDLLLWLFGSVERSELHLNRPDKMAGALQLERARVRWFLSVDGRDLPETSREAGQFAYRSLRVDGEELEFSQGFGDLHQRVYEAILAGRGEGISEARPAISLVRSIRESELSAATIGAHPLLSLRR
ncbi:MAG: oxidoreductase [Rickettsiales bacterium]|nr:oxidoreductase [Rickettsiales bacterium]|tara:strand:- start:874 stop:1824 length:951 start_codon:yes stop_codon:yes gene_type:complete